MLDEMFQRNASKIFLNDQGIHWEEIIKLHEINMKKKIHGFSKIISYSKNMTNFDAFCWNISSGINLLFLKSDT